MIAIAPRPRLSLLALSALGAAGALGWRLAHAPIDRPSIERVSATHARRTTAVAAPPPIALPEPPRRGVGCEAPTWQPVAAVLIAKPAHLRGCHVAGDVTTLAFRTVVGSSRMRVPVDCRNAAWLEAHHRYQVWIWGRGAGGRPVSVTSG